VRVRGWVEQSVSLLVGIFVSLTLSFAGGTMPGQSQVVDLNGRRVEPLKVSPARALVLIFTRTDCPISNRYAPELKKLHEKFVASGVKFQLVYPGPDESVESIRRHIRDYEYWPDVLRDPRHELVKLTGVRVTPEVAVFVPDGSVFRMVYRGRIDDRYVAFGKMRPAPATRDLEQVLEAISKGRSVTKRTTTAIGCFIQ